MNAPMFAPLLRSESLDERVELLTRELELALQWNRAAIVMAVYNSEYVRAEVESALENSLIERHQRLACIDLIDKAGAHVAEYLHDFPSTENFVFFLTAAKRSAMQQTNLFMELDRHKDVLKNQGVRLVLWLTQNEITRLAYCAPELWTARQRVVEFVDAPKPEQILQTAIETSWIGTGEFADLFADTEDQITLRQAYLSELPQAAEATSTRANLLLTLGVLHWRKGDFEKAETLLRDALRAAIQMEDNWFEAECYNAIALVKSSRGKNDEAIDDYKHAIRLAPEQIFVWNNLGNLCMKILRTDEAMHAFQKALEQNQKDPIAWCGLGGVYYKIGYLDDSIAAYRKALEFAPALGHPWAGLGDAYASVGREADAVGAYQKAIEANPQYILPWLRLADIYCRQTRYRDAIKAFQSALRIDAHNIEVWNELGLMFLKIESFEEAVLAFSRANELNRSFGPAYTNLAIAFAKLGNHPRAIALCQKSLEIFTDDCDKAMVWNQLADFYRASRDYENALQAYKSADALNGNLRIDIAALAAPVAVGVLLEVPALKDEARSAEHEGLRAEDRSRKPEVASAPKWLLTNQRDSDSQAVDSSTVNDPPAGADLEPDDESDDIAKQIYLSDFPIDGDEMTESTNSTVWNEKGNVHFQKGAYDEAIRAYNKAIELDRSFGWPYSNLALTYVTLGKFAEAILLYQRSATLLETQNEQAAVWNSLGNIYRHLNDYDNARIAYQRADELDPQTAGRRGRMELSQSEPNSQNAQVWIELGNLFLKAGSYNEAVAAYEKAVQIEPVSAWAQSNLALGYVFQGKYQEAVPLYLKSIENFTEDQDKATAWNRLGNVYRKMNDYQNAKQAYQQAVMLSHDKNSLLTRTRFTLLGNVFAN